VHFAAPPFARIKNDEWQQQSRTLFAAQQRAAVQLRSPTGLHCFGIRLQPAASTVLTAAVLPTLTDQIVDLDSLAPSFSESFRQLAPSNAAADLPKAFVQFLEQQFLGYPIDKCIEQAVAILKINHGNYRIEKLAAEVNLKLRTLQNRFQALVGLSAKEFAQLMRLQAAIKLLDTQPASLAALAGDSGFADQAHATRTLQRSLGITPLRLLKALQHDLNADNTVQLAAAFVRGRSG
jgi:AraC-like DNA-binding protein